MLLNELYKTNVSIVQKAPRTKILVLEKSMFIKNQELH